MAIPTINSIKVKPFCLFLLVIDIKGYFFLYLTIFGRGWANSKQRKTCAFS
jgi:hypothetical protein